MLHLLVGGRGARSDRDPLRWSWLAENGGTDWYVPAEHLQAFGWQTDALEAVQSIDDQTVWHIEHYENGYIFGAVVFVTQRDALRPYPDCKRVTHRAHYRVLPSHRRFRQGGMPSRSSDPP
jgi:hypothetical protein